MSNNYSEEDVQELIESVKLVRSIIMDGCPSGFNPLEGDWAERLFFSQSTTSKALEKFKEV